VTGKRIENYLILEFVNTYVVIDYEFTKKGMQYCLYAMH
jgi:hypothetical protein